MANHPAYDPTDARYYDEKDLRSEVERIFGLCADCRMCVKFCGSFPKMFDAVDDYCTEGKYAEVDTKKFKNKEILKMFRDVLAIGYRLHIKRWYQRQLASLQLGEKEELQEEEKEQEEGQGQGQR